MSGNCELGRGLRTREYNATEAGAGRYEKPAPDARAAPPEAHESPISRKTIEEVPLTGLSLMSDVDEGSAAMLGSQPAVWAIRSPNGQYRLPDIVDGVKVCRFRDNDRYVPLYAEDPTKPAASEWILAAERLPADGAWCWVNWDDPGDPFPAMRYSRAAGGWTNGDTWEDFDREVTHWMPLPAPPTDAK